MKNNASFPSDNHLTCPIQSSAFVSDQEYRSPSAAARAAQQLERAGKSLRPGQKLRFLYTLGKPRVYAWDMPVGPEPKAIDVKRYIELLLRAASTIM